MAINPDELRRHLEDYEKVFGTKVEKFVCPITLNEIPESELQNGHILNEGIIKANRKTVIQWTKIDGFYGTRVEPSLIEHINFPKRDIIEIFKNSKLLVRFEDGSEKKLLLADTPAGIAASKNNSFKKVPIQFPGHDPFYGYVISTDPIDKKVIDVVTHITQYPFHWIASMIKAYHLAMFYKFGYAVLTDPFNDSLRRSLKGYFEDNGSRDDAEKYFKDLPNCLKFVQTYAIDPKEPYRPLPFDTLTDQRYFSFQTPDKSIFAMGVIFQMNDISAVVIVPSYVHAKTDPEKCAKAYSAYTRLMNEDVDLKYTVHDLLFDGEKWVSGTQPINVRIMDY